MPFDADDLAAFADTDMPGYAAATVAGFGTVAGLFRARAADAFGIQGSGPEFRCPASLVDGLAQGAAVTIAGTSYTVATVEGGDDTPVGMALIKLQAA